MSIGYACLNMGVPNTKFKSCILKNANEENLRDLIKWNLNVINNMLDYLIKNDIKMFRLSSDIIPFASHPINTIKWEKEFSKELNKLGKKAIENNIRLSMHPGQYTVINSPDKLVVERAIKDLEYHTKFLDSLGLNKEHKVILHIGGIYHDKEEAINRFILEYRKLKKNIKDRLVIENDDKQYNISDVLKISEQENIPVVFDNLHHEINIDNTLSINEWLKKCSKTWKKEDGKQKTHYSQQAISQRVGSHSKTINLDLFLDYYNSLENKNIDIMLEVKDKNLSAIKVNNTIARNEIKYLEEEWAKYKYLVLENSPKIYNKIRNLLKDKNEYPVIDFYNFIQEASECEFNKEYAINAADHVWGYFKDKEDSKTKEKFEKSKESIIKKNNSLQTKRFLYNLSKKYEDKYLLNSYYFMDLIE